MESIEDMLRKLAPEALNPQPFAINHVDSLLSILVLVVVWSFMRPNMIRDGEDRRLPNNPTARLAFAMACAVIYLTLAFAFQVFSGMTDAITMTAPLLKGLLRPFKDQPPLLAGVTLMGLLQLKRFHDIERTAIVWLHSRRHVTDDVRALSGHLERTTFEPSPEEHNRNRDNAKKYGVYITDSSVNSVGVVTIEKWHKVSALLRLVREWNAADAIPVLGKDDVRLLGDIETSHERKTGLALTIVRMYDEVEKGGEASKALSAMLKLLADTPHINRASVEAAETRAKLIGLGGIEEMEQKPVRLTSEQLHHHLVQIERYFELEYQMLTQQAASLAAKSVVLSGEQAGERLESLRAAGFAGLGRIQIINLDRVLWLFLIVAFGGFLVMYTGYRTTMTLQQAEGLARFALGMSIAALIGAIVGSRRRYSRAAETPWSKYLTGGLIAGTVFLGINVLWAMVKSSFNLNQADASPPMPTYNLLPWALLPCLTTIAIARLARIERWRTPRALHHLRSLYGRVLDAIWVSCALAIAFSTAIAVHAPLGIKLPPNVQAQVDTSWLPTPINWSLLSLGFLIGFVVVREVRRAAHSTIIAKSAIVTEPDADLEPKPANGPAAAIPIHAKAA